ERRVHVPLVALHVGQREERLEPVIPWGRECTGDLFVGALTLAEAVLEDAERGPEPRQHGRARAARGRHPRGGVAECARGAVHERERDLGYARAGGELGLGVFEAGDDRGELGALAYERARGARGSRSGSAVARDASAWARASS